MTKSQPTPTFLSFCPTNSEVENPTVINYTSSKEEKKMSFAFRLAIEREVGGKLHFTDQLISADNLSAISCWFTLTTDSHIQS